MAFSCEEQDRRYTAIRKLMEKDELDCLLVAGRGDNHGRANIRYITDHGVISLEAYCVFPMEGTPILLTRYAVNLDKRWSIACRQSARNPVEQVKEALARSYKGNKIGIVGIEDISGRVYLAVQTQFGDKLVDATEAFEQLRSTKSPEEIERMRISASIGDSILAAVREKVRPGVSDYEIYAEVKRITFEMGCEYSFDEISVGSMWNLFSPVGKRLEPGNAVSLNISPAYKGYFTQSPVTLPVGECQPEMRRLISVWEEALGAAVSILLPGTKASDVYLEIAKVGSQAGYQSQSGKCGHEIGLALTESCQFTVSDTTELKPGMTVALHPSLAEPGGADVRMGYTYLITDTGSEKLNKVDIAQTILR